MARNSKAKLTPTQNMTALFQETFSWYTIFLLFISIYIHSILMNVHSILLATNRIRTNLNPPNSTTDVCTATESTWNASLCEKIVAKTNEQYKEAVAEGLKDINLIAIFKNGVNAAEYVDLVPGGPARPQSQTVNYNLTLIERNAKYIRSLPQLVNKSTQLNLSAAQNSYA